MADAQNAAAGGDKGDCGISLEVVSKPRSEVLKQPLNRVMSDAKSIPIDSVLRGF